MNLYKKIENNIKEFFLSSFEYTKKESMIFLIIFLLMIIGTIFIIGILSDLLLKISLMYILISIALIIRLSDVINDLIEYIIIVYLLPYIFLIMLIDKNLKKFVPYKGNDLMQIRLYKLKLIKRKVRINKLKFWK